MKVKYNDNYIKRKIREHDDILLEKIDNYYIVRDSIDGYYYIIDEYLHFSSPIYTIKDICKVLEEIKEDKNAN